jgi:acarbose 7IV-phosphotransferase
VAGVGYNVGKALHTLGNPVRLVGLLGRDPLSQLAAQTIQADGLDGRYLLPHLPHLPRSVILYEGTGRRQIHLDLKDIQESRYPEEQFTAALAGCQLAVMSTVNFNRFLLPLARAAGLPIATDVQAIRDLHDDYNRDFMASADILFQSHEQLPCPPEEWAEAIFATYPARIVGIGMGADGALLAVRGQGVRRFAAVATRPIVNTIGAGDALFSAFLHGYAHHADPWQAMATAVLFASWKIGTRGASEGFLTAAELAHHQQQPR